MRLTSAWARRRPGSRATIVLMIIVIVFQVLRAGIAALTGDWSHILDIGAIICLSWTVLTWVKIASIERESRWESPGQNW